MCPFSRSASCSGSVKPRQAKLSALKLLVLLLLLLLLAAHGGRHTNTFECWFRSAYYGGIGSSGAFFDPILTKKGCSANFYPFFLLFLLLLWPSFPFRELSV